MVGGFRQVLAERAPNPADPRLTVTEGPREDGHGTVKTLALLLGLALTRLVC
jgi:hypothetical protein